MALVSKFCIQHVIGMNDRYFLSRVVSAYSGFSDQYTRVKRNYKADLRHLNTEISFCDSDRLYHTNRFISKLQKHVCKCDHNHNAILVACTNVFGFERRALRKGLHGSWLSREPKFIREALLIEEDDEEDEIKHHSDATRPSKRGLEERSFIVLNFLYTRFFLLVGFLVGFFLCLLINADVFCCYVDTMM